MTATRNVPHSLEAERATLGGCLMRPSAIDELAELKPTDFFLGAHGQVWAAIVALRASGAAVDALTVAERAGVGTAMTTSLMEAWELAGPASAAKIVIEASRKRRLISLCSEMLMRAHDAAEDSTALIAEIRTALAGVEVSGSDEGPTHIGEGILGALATLEDRARGEKIDGIATGIEQYDTRIGRLQPGQLAIVAGLPGQGKSAFAQGAADHAARNGHPVLVLNFEMSKGEQIERFLSARSNVTADSMRKPRGIQYADWRRITDAASNINALPVWLDTRPLTISQTLGMARRWYAKHANNKHALVVVDYVQLMRTEGKRQNRERDVADISTGLKQLAMTPGCAITVMALSQINRMVAREARKPMIQDLRESGQLEADADLILFPWREMATTDDENRTSFANESGPAELIVGKNRGGRTGSIAIHWKAEVMRFFDAAPSHASDPPFQDREVRFE